jgi:hypothetical protein
MESGMVYSALAPDFAARIRAVLACSAFFQLRGGVKMKLEIPRSLKMEHEELHDMLRKATQEPCEVGDAALTVAKLMHPHFVKEEEVALPPLGLLRDLAQGKLRPDMKEALVLTEKLKADLGAMLEEHKAIVVALDRLAAAAKNANKTEYVAFAHALKLHAQTEEEVAYPAAMLVGEYLKAKLASQ